MTCSATRLADVSIGFTSFVSDLQSDQTGPDRRAVLVEVLEREGLELDAAMEVELGAFLEPDGELRWRFINGLVREGRFESNGNLIRRSPEAGVRRP